MSQCNEAIYDLAKIQAFKKGVLQYSAPENVVRPYVTSDFIEGDVSTGTMPMQIGTSEAKDTLDEDSGGKFHKVSISWDIDDISTESLDAVKLLKESEYDLLLTPIEGQKMLVRTCDNGYSATVTTEDGIITVELDILSFNGLQFIME